MRQSAKKMSGNETYKKNTFGSFNMKDSVQVVVANKIDHITKIKVNKPNLDLSKQKKQALEKYLEESITHTNRQYSLLHITDRSQPLSVDVDSNLRNRMVYQKSQI